ncbi:mannose-1-phosphate guanylyltransferase [Parerythrobacter jejuensis]|uniref:NTP transferase domain-containing protein n=1 Tax=Parerythrobacter jejuensis TaxID=795812 RepID=A0A845APN7_9SPHN|nr:mannose-1-phosphate guanylyltransferase [Parerythrobacter jejuensis]MXP30865.1 NTP transferase domain-containing protein [Parerythrobacter jejuensis]MXP33625.1 NTP transferase domain-containing protein [Parerythrobacter jejuensis]
MTELIHPVILCGGGGTRLWPRSRPDLPKPFLPLLGERSLFQQTLDRVQDTTIFAGATVVAGTGHMALIRAQADAALGLGLIAEPMGRNTAPAIALAAHLLPADAVMLVCPSDHYIADTDAFVAAAQSGATLARDGFLVSLGITADRPETGYGYIKRGEPAGAGYRVDRFVEKPDSDTARKFLADGSYSWNGGIFLFTASRFLEELTQHRPAMARQIEIAVQQGETTDGIFRPDEKAFAAIEGDSIDYAVMEPTGRAAMVPVSMGWSDIGNWQALAEARGGASRGPHDLIDAGNIVVDSDGPRVSVVGLDNLIVVVDGNEVLVTTPEGAQKVGKLPGAQGT